jgi:2-oxoisovalerate dehydrogenase E2 component (dihydrolipoyl transacylase)
MKKAMTKTMTESRTIPFLTYSDAINGSELINLRKELKVLYPKLTLLPFFIKACSLAMTDLPIVNSQVDNDLDADGYI